MNHLIPFVIGAVMIKFGYLIRKNYKAKMDSREKIDTYYLTQHKAYLGGIGLIVIGIFMIVLEIAKWLQE